MPRRSALRWLVPLLLCMQIGLLWLQGVQLRQQNLQIRDLRSDLQDLADSLDSSQDSDQDDSSAVPLRHHLHARRPFLRTSHLILQEEKDAKDEGEADIRAARESAQKAVKEAREDQSKLSIEENARKAEEARKVQGATSAWQTWSLAALGLLVVAWLIRAYLRNR